MARMTDSELVRAIETLETAADDGELSEQRAKALEYYRGDNTNEAPEGRSQVVDRSLYDVAESVKGPVLKLFLSGEETVKFSPRGPEDIKASEQESAYVNFQLNEKNDAFSIFSGWLQDAFTQKNGYVQATWDETQEVGTERYTGLTDDEYMLLMSSGDAEVVEHAEAVDAYGMRSHDVAIKRTSTYGCVKIQNVPPESVLVDPNLTTVSLTDAAFVCRREEKTISELRQSGFDVEDEISDGGTSHEDWESDLRREQSWREQDGGSEPDPSMRRVKCREVWIRTDRDGDGIAELRHVVVVGSTVLLDEEADSIPLVAFCAKPLPHQHYGESFYDELKEVQDVKTALLRGVLDSLYLANSPRYGVNADRVNLDDLLVSRPGGIVRVDGEPMGAIMPLSVAYNPAPALQAMEYMDVVRETRTGVTRVGTGLDPNALNKTASGIAMLQGAQSQRIELIARHFAESVKELCLLVHALTLKHSRQQELIMLRNEWVPVDPRQWTRRKDMSISVGLGTGNRQEQSAFLMNMLQLAFGPGMQLGLSSPAQVYQMLSKLTNAAGFKNAEEFWSDPSKRPPAPPQQPPPDPKLIEVQQKGQMEAQKMQMTAQQDQQRAQMDMQVESAKLQQQMALEQQKLQANMQLEQQKLAIMREQNLMQLAAEVLKAQAQPAEGEMDDEGPDEGAMQMQQMMQMLAQTVASLQQSMALAAAPRRIVRDPATGRAMGVETVQ
jgi:hypothetical protein